MTRLLVIVAAICVGLYLWMDKSDEFKADPNSPSGFASVVMPAGSKPNTVVIFAPKNCPSAAAQRASSMVQALNKAGIPNQLMDHFSLSIDNPSESDQAKLKQIEILLNEGKIPHVFVNNMAKSNPTVEEVKSEYYRTL